MSEVETIAETAGKATEASRELGGFLKACSAANHDSRAVS